MFSQRAPRGAPAGESNEMRISSFAAATGLALTLCLGAAAQAAPITTLFGTGLDAAGAPLALGAADPHYTVVETGTPAVVLNPPHANYFANDANSQWVWQQANGQPINVTRTFRTTFDLTGFNLATVAIDGAWGTDNQGLDILLNGASLGISLPGVDAGHFTSLHAFSIDSGFVTGLNTLDFVIHDDGSVAAFRAELSGTAEVPEPAGLALLGLGLLGLGLRRRRVR